VAGYTKIEKNLVGVSEQKEVLDSQKDQTLQEITRIVKDITEQVKEKKHKLAPEIKRLRTLRQKYNDLEGMYNQKKKEYENIANNLDQGKTRLEEEVKTLFEEYRQEETRFHWNNIQSEIYDAFLKRIQNEAKYLNQADKRLSNEFKSYSDFFNAKLRQQENIIKDLKQHQKMIKDNTENFAVQQTLFRNLRELLEVKKACMMQGGGDHMRVYQDSSKGVDRLGLRD